MALKETVERLRASRIDDAIDGELVTRWQREVSGLYDRIAEWLKPYVEDGGITLERKSKMAHEERTGPYQIDQLDIGVGDEIVRLDPVGTIVIGAWGRIDMSHLGSGDPQFIVLVGDKSQLYWAVVDPAMRGELKRLDAEQFEATLDHLLERYGIASGPLM